jgi:hypothetical protein
LELVDVSSREAVPDHSFELDPRALEAEFEELFEQSVEGIFCWRNPDLLNLPVDVPG